MEMILVRGKLDKCPICESSGCSHLTEDGEPLGLWVEKVEGGEAKSLKYEYSDGNQLYQLETTDTDFIRILLEVSGQL